MVYKLKTDAETRAYVQLLMNFKGVRTENIFNKVDISRSLLYSRADMCLNCSLSVKSMKFGMMIVFKVLKKIGYGAIAEKSVKCEK